MMVKIKSPLSKGVGVIVRDKERPLTIYSRYYGDISKEKVFEIRMPISPIITEIVIRCDNEIGVNVDFDFGILNQTIGMSILTNPLVVRFLKFSQEFTRDSAYLEDNGNSYISDDYYFRIDYLSQIGDSNTPARISKDTGVIEISKKKFCSLTVSEQMAILLHEFSHFYLNSVMEDEEEADRNALNIYLAMGYPRIQAYDAFLNVFAEAPSELNYNRYKKIENIIDTFTKNNK